mmetsp:Transcript_14670/g.46134  ORF Transcript_14670/g.46134 Transcript_14670/m.46134 type:complete len:650 (+) Transcript_14670:89-2038(+)|eukprot:CAMPEP_0204599232 /NCGR_PEP_ID=MMETSP0661-20131031/54711_1 /ASSEMBLY_ACC=CAM_ASM_000606 /TAXON_ID=109239 /ORGANISM="Alexandrium margalefi, Strain AMGDE01CS-322" /LENGTH=649 /DNA_ID=CAMNT_0051609947 /DNA_START=79 /DNA_END=2028 /DNA_ORIENTATION=+
MGGDSSSDEETDTENGSAQSSEEAQLDAKGPHRHLTNPVEENRNNWYETGARVRMAYLVFISVAVCFSVSCSIIVNVFFSIMSPDEQDYALVIRVLLIPVALVLSAALVDMMLHLGLDGMTTPSMALWRATFTLLLQPCSAGFSTRGAERVFLVLFESVPMLAALISLFTGGRMSPLDLVIRSMNHYLRGAVFLIFCLALEFLVARMYVQANSTRESKMVVLYNSMECLGHLGGNADAAIASRISGGSIKHRLRRHWVWVVGVFLVVAIDLLILLVFHFRKRFDVLLIGQFIITILMAVSIKSQFSRTVGRGFWWVFVFFFALTFGLWLVAHAQMGEAKNFAPLCVGPSDPSYGQPGLDLPLKFTPPRNGRGYGYPICGEHWGNRNMTEDGKLNVLDLAALAYASSYPETEDILHNLHAVLDQTALGTWNLTHAEPSDVVGRWIVVDFPEQRTRVVAVRGTTTLEDVFADLEVYGGIAVFEWMNLWTPVLQVLGSDTIRMLINVQVPKFWYRFLEAVKLEKARAIAEGSTLVITGHSLGAALTGVGAAETDVQSVGFSGPGLFYQTKHLGVDLTNLEHVFTNIQPYGDVVPRVDRQHGSVNWVKCNGKAAKCHSLTKTACELWSQCGDPRGRDFRHACSKWYTRADLNI